MAQHNFAGAPPADRHEIADPAADDQPCRTGAVTQETVRVEDCSGKQAVSILTGNELAAMQVPGQDEVVAGMAGCLPDSRVMRAQDADMAIMVWRGLRTGNRDYPPPVRHTRGAIVDPVSAATDHCLTNMVEADLAVVIAANGKDRRNLLEAANQARQRRQLGATVYEVTPQQHHVRLAASRGGDHLPAESVGTTVPEVNVADIQQPTYVVPCRQSLFADV
jgi:hypothetical protein